MQKSCNSSRLRDLDNALAGPVGRLHRGLWVAPQAIQTSKGGEILGRGASGSLANIWSTAIEPLANPYRVPIRHLSDIYPTDRKWLKIMPLWLEEAYRQQGRCGGKRARITRRRHERIRRGTPQARGGSSQSPVEYDTGAL
jgi:hypothetical protein